MVAGISVGVKELAIRIDQRPTKIESPVRHYERPHDILNDRSLTMHSKLAALDSWELDAQALQRAEDEGMGGGETTMLIDVADAKKEIGARSISRQAK